MTKKSVARLERDEKKKAVEKMIKNPESNLMSWSDLDKIYEDNSQMLIQANQNMAEVFRFPGIIENVPDKKGTIDHIRGLAKDVRFFGSELVKIKQQHEGKEGIVKDSDGTIEAIKIFEGYVHWQQEYHGVIIPTVTFLSEQAGLAAEEIEKASGIQDPNVITDVVVKQPSEQPVAVVDNTPQADDTPALTQ